MAIHASALWGDEFAWTPRDHPSNDYGVGYLTPLRRSDGAVLRAAFDERQAHNLFEKWDGTQALPPSGSLVHYGSLYPVLLRDFDESAAPPVGGEGVGGLLRFDELRLPVDETRLLVYNGCHNSQRDPRALVTERNLADLFRGCQSLGASCRALKPRKRDFRFRIAVYVERLNYEGGVLLATYPKGATCENVEVAQLRKMGNNFRWYARLRPHVERGRSEDFPYAQPACALWFRRPMGRVELYSRRVCRDTESFVDEE